jgi:hypothetical protein
MTSPTIVVGPAGLYGVQYVEASTPLTLWFLSLGAALRVAAVLRKRA